ncbi:MAG: hypothetical protein ACLFVJ_16205 [Persicimonas sp.]
MTFVSKKHALHALFIILAIALSAALIGCDKSDQAAASSEEAAATDQQDDHEGHDEHEEYDKYAGWCHGHDLPEEYCTKCHPELVDKYKEEGDWCDEHGFPLSACPEHNPMDPPEEG